MRGCDALDDTLTMHFMAVQGFDPRTRHGPACLSWSFDPAKRDNGEVADKGDGADWSALHQQLTDFLVEIGRCMKLEVVTDYGVPGGQLDLVWCWVPPSPVPGLVAPVPVVGFEIESGGQTRKQVKGDLLNLRDAGVALGVIVLAGADPEDDSLRRFATALVNRPGPRVLVWTEEDLNALVAEQSPLDATESGVTPELRGRQAPLSSFGVTYAPAAVQHTGRYRSLSEWLRRQDGEPIHLTFEELEQLIGITLPEPCHHHVSPWKSYQDSVVARAIVDAGWYAREIDLGAKAIVLQPEPPLAER